MRRKVTMEEFLERANSKHNNFYDYSKVNLVNVDTGIEIICPSHGPFSQKPFKHLRGQGCPKCRNKKISLSKTKSFDEFLSRAHEIHGDRYIYNEETFNSFSEKMVIVCKEHGNFLQTPSRHVQGRGCPKCAGNIKYENEDFIEKANKVHNCKYDYSKIEYKTGNDKIEIICPEHGSFWQKASNHLLGNGCPQCANNVKFDNSLFIKRAKIKHGDKYDYSKVNYVDSQSKIIITCPKHGDFKQVPNSHLQGKGCPKCAGLESPQELMIIKKLSDLGIECKHNIIVDERYPWHVDIYIPERDLFIEYNGFWSHQPGLGWYSPRNKKHQETKSHLENNYQNWIPLTWWTSDVEKRKAAKKNNLNYVVLWNERDIEDWFALDCPDGHDGDGMYTWKDCNPQHN